MAKPEWGFKRICPSCGTRYYDLTKNPPTCPKCATVYDPDALLKSRRGRSSAVIEDVQKSTLVDDVLDIDTGALKVGGVADDLDEIDDVDDAKLDSDSLIEDADELGEDDIEVVELEDEDNVDDV
ncbi:MAG: TIGR02300 family protein [Alphaproteobacteria bacterium]